MEAIDHYQTGLEQKKQGQNDAALTSFRRAVIADPLHAASHLEIGLLCREKAKTDKMFLRYSFDAFRKAAQLDPTNEQAHTYYVTVAQKIGLLEELLDEYSALVKKSPDNALFVRTHKNVIALTMAMMPQQVSIGPASASSGIQKFALFASIVMLLAGIGFLVAPAMLLKQGKIQKDQVGGMVRLGIVIEAIGIAGLVFRKKLG